MPRTLRKQQWRGDEIVVAWQSFATQTDTIIAGTRLRGDHPMVREFPQHFVPADTPQSEMPTVWDFVPEPNPGTFIRSAGADIPDEEAAICHTAFTRGIHVVGKGERRRWDDELVQATRDLWRMAPLPVPEK
jgi:hypothetical protein